MSTFESSYPVGDGHAPHLGAIELTSFDGRADNDNSRDASAAQPTSVARRLRRPLGLPTAFLFGLTAALFVTGVTELLSVGF